MRHAKRVDSNHAQIRDELRALGYEVHDFSHVGGGVADLCVRTSPTMSIWLEIKATNKDKLTDKEVIFKTLWADVYHIVTTTREAEDILLCIGLGI